MSDEAILNATRNADGIDHVCPLLEDRHTFLEAEICVGVEMNGRNLVVAYYPQVAHGQNPLFLGEQGVVNAKMLVEEEQWRHSARLHLAELHACER